MVVNEVQRLSNEMIRKVLDDPVFAYGIIIAVILVLITTIILFLLQRRKNLRNSILIVGLSDSGKTLLFSKLFSAKQVTTYTSMTANTGAVITPFQRKKVQLVDIPGNERLRSKFLDEYVAACRGVIFVIDSLTFQKEIRDVASYLYSVLQEHLILKNAVPFLIVCNKQDHAVAKSAKVIQSQLEKEMNALRQTQTGKLNSTSPEEENVFLGQKGKEFQFVDLKPIKVEFAECSALESGDGETSAILPHVWTWISKVA